MSKRASVVGFDFQQYNQQYLSRILASTNQPQTNGSGSKAKINDAEQYDVRIVPAQLAPGQLYWRVIGVRHLQPAENTGKHNLYAELLGEDGKRLHDANIQLQRGWEGQRADEVAPPVNFDKGENEPATNIPIESGQHLWVQIDGDLPSDRVENLHTKHADETGPNGEIWNSIGHHSFYVVFQRARQAGNGDTHIPTPELADDANYVDGRDAIPALAVMQPGQHFEQIWTIRNSGSSHWDNGYQLVWVGGKPLRSSFFVPAPPCAPNGEIAITVPFTAPTEPGPHYSIWRMANKRGDPFGERVWLLINVVDPHALHPHSTEPAPPTRATMPATPDDEMMQPTGRGVRPASSQSQPTARLPEQTIPDSGGAANAVRDPELHAAWKKHIENGFANNQQMFQQLLNGFMNPYWTTVWMYRILFGLGVASFLVAAALSAFANKEGYTLVFGGLSAIALLAYFFNRPLQALEENLQFITWLGLIYNSYWTRLVYLNSQPDVQKGLQDATDDAIKRIKELMAAHAKSSGKREAFPKG